MKQWIRDMRLLMILVIITLVSSAGIAQAAAFQEPQIVRVGFPPSEGMSEIHEDGTKSGITYDWLVEIAKYTGWKYEFVVAPIEELLVMMEEGRLDLMGGMYKMDEFEVEYFYPSYVEGTNYSLLLARKGNTELKSFDLNTFNGAEIGVYAKAEEKIQQLKYFLEYNSLSCDIRYYEEGSEFEQALDKEEVDLLLGNDADLTSDYFVAAKLTGQPYYIVARKELTEISRQLDLAIKEIYMANPNFAAEAYAANFPSFYENSILLTEEEQDFVERAEPIRVALIRERYPLNYSREGIDQGICRDVFKLISERTGLEFKFLYAENYQEMLDLVNQGEADLASSFMDGEFCAETYDMVLTKKYAELDEVILKNKMSDYPSDEAVLAIVEGRCTPVGVRQDKVRYYSTYAECVDAIERREADYSFIPSSFVEDLFYKNYYSQVTIVSSYDSKSNVSIAVPKPVPIRLYALINKAVNSISDIEMENIIYKNLISLGEKNLSILSIIYANPVTSIIVCVTFIFLVILMIFLFAMFKMKNRLMKEKLQRAEEASKAKSDFLSQMSHEIRTPMNAIIGLTQLARNSEDVTAPMDRRLEKIDTAAQFLLSLVNDILDMAKIESNKMRLNPVPFRMKDLLRQIESMILIQADKKNIRMEIQFTIEDELFVGDSVRLKQVMINLLSNALKFTEPGGVITLKLEECERNSEMARLRFSVADNGVGIEKHDMERIFQSFEQVSGELQTNHGTGLGLVISSNLVRLMGGELSVQSEPGKGSEFYFSIWLPLCKEIEIMEKKGKESYSSLRGLHLLLAEDNELNAEIVMALLEMNQISVDWVCDGNQAVEAYKKHPEGYYGAILMDIQMPVKDGLRATKEIRAMERPDAGQIPIIAMTANTFQEDQDKAMDAGMNGFVPKPFDVKQLYQILAYCMNKK